MRLRGTALTLPVPSLPQLPHSKNISTVLAEMRAVGETTCPAAGRLGYPEPWLLSNCDITKCCPAPSVALTSTLPVVSVPCHRQGEQSGPCQPIIQPGAQGTLVPSGRFMLIHTGTPTNTIIPGQDGS